MKPHGVVYTGDNCVYMHGCVCVCARGGSPELQNSLFPFAKPEQLQCVCVCVSMMEEMGVTQT